MGALTSSEPRPPGAALRRIAEEYGEFNIVVVDVPGTDTEALAQRLAKAYDAEFVSRTSIGQDADDSVTLASVARTLLRMACSNNLDGMYAALTARAVQELRMYAALRRGEGRVRVFAHSYVEERVVMMRYAAAVAAAAHDPDQASRGGALPGEQLRVLQSLNRSVQSVAVQAVPPHLTLWVYARHTERAWGDLLRNQPAATHATLNALRRLLDQEMSGSSVGQFFATHNSACIAVDSEQLAAHATVGDVADLVDRFCGWLRDQGLLLPSEQATLARSIATTEYLQRRNMLCTRGAIQTLTAGLGDPPRSAKQ